MFVAGLLGGLLLAVAKANELPATWTGAAHSGVFEFNPSTMPIDPSEGWNFSRMTEDGVFPYNASKPLHDKRARAFTTMVGAQLKAYIFGYNAVVSGWVPDQVETTLEAFFDDDEAHANKTTVKGLQGRLISLDANGTQNKWRTLTLTLREGEVRVDTIAMVHDLQVSYPSTADMPYKTVNATQFGSGVIQSYYKTKGDWKTQNVYETGKAEIESPHIRGAPGAEVSFETWPYASTLVLEAQHGREKGQVTYKVSPPPYGMREEVTVSLHRPFEGVNTFGRVVLDPEQRYTVTVINSDKNAVLSFCSANYNLGSDKGLNWNPEAEDKKSGPNVGAIAGGVVGGVVGAALLVGLLWFLYRRRHSANPLADDDKFVVDDTAMASASYVTPMPMPSGPGAMKPGYPGTMTSSEGQQLLADGTLSHHRTSFSLSSSGQTYLPHQPFHPPQEDDAGPIGRMDTVPPSYNPDWAGPPGSSSSGPSGPDPSQTVSRSSFMSSTPSQPAVPLHLHGGYDVKNLHAMDAEPAEEEPRPEAPPLPSKAKLPES